MMQLDSRIDQDILYIRLIRAAMLSPSGESLNDPNEAVRFALNILAIRRTRGSLYSIQDYAIIAKELTDEPEDNVELIRMLYKYINKI